ncbi:hypothetical protein NQD34_001872 [Periophthalmus magnuspinnatus]|nr:hypothetical protein NQD34_001872 [Periophthalmus magnuspinnatus]
MQTMNYVGQLAGQVFVQVKELYRGLNPATLSGCIDVIVVRQPDGSLQCSPFHVRFGKMGVLRSREKVVDIEVNGEPVSLHMKLGENGEAFFVKETENTLEIIPSYLATSPIMSVGEELMESQLNRNPSQRHDIILGSSLPVQNLGPQTDGGMSKKRRKRRRRVWPDGGGGRRNDSEQSEDEDMFTIDLSSDEDSDITRYIRVCPPNASLILPLYISQQFFMHIPLDPFSVSVCSFSTLIKDTLSIHPPCGLSISCPQQTFHLPSISPDDSQSSTPKSDSEISNQKKDNPEMLWTWGELPQAAQVITTIMFKLTACSMSPRSLSDHLDGGGVSGSPMRRNDSPSKKKGKNSFKYNEIFILNHRYGVFSLFVCLFVCLFFSEKRSQHLGTDGVYLDDITELEPEVAALYFPKSDGGSSSVKLDSDMMMCVRSENHSPQSVGSSGMDSGVDSLPDHFSDLPHVAISLCGGLTDNKEITREQFQQRAVSYQQFSENPSIIDDPNLVVKIGNKYYNWNTAAPVMLAMQVYQKPLPQASVENIMKERMPKKGGRWWFSWRSRNNDSKSVFCAFTKQTFNASRPYPESHISFRVKDDSSSDEDHRSSNVVSGSVQPEPLDASSGVCYKKTLRLTSEQLTSLQLREGPNDVVFSVTTQYQGTCRCNGTIYLWSWDDKIVISDIDGTITRSDTLGHILPTLGKDWTHQGIARLYHKVSLNGYKFMYCSARAIGMADMTRGYLNWVNERGTMLPMGPVLLSPSSLFSALHREVIEKKPEKFKVECLTDIKQLFYPNTEPFYAAFGNRATDVYSYKEVGVPLNRIFTVNPKGELTQEHAKTNISSFGHLCEMVDHVFPVLLQDGGADVSKNFDQWSKQLDEMNSDEAEDSLQTIETS